MDNLIITCDEIIDVEEADKISDKISAKQQHLLPFHDAKLKRVYINNLN